ncbi:MAG: GlxA family transcriptional regulator [Pseudomonadales bacterium]
MPLFSPSPETLHVTLLLLPESSLMSLAATLDTMRAANRLSRRHLFQWRVVSLDGEPVELSCGQRIHPDAAFSDSCSGDLLICIAAFHHSWYMPEEQLRHFKRRAKVFPYVGAVESGSWILARAGMLSGKRATTHWEDLEDFRDSYPQVNVLPDRYAIDGRLFTTGGASPTIDLMLHLIGMRYGHPLALEVASIFIYDGAGAQSPQPLVSLGPLQQQAPRVSRAVQLMSEQIDEPLTITAIASKLGMSNRTLQLLFQRELGVTPHAYYRRLRLQSAKRLVQNSNHSMLEISVRTGFSSLASFSREFKKYYGASPSHLR